MEKVNSFVLACCDTDSITFGYSDGREISVADRERLLKELNSLFPPRIRWEDEGLVERMMVVRTKNYVIDSKGKRTIKGAAIRATPKESALQEFIKETIELLMTDNGNQVPLLYQKYAREIQNLSDITRWCSKKTISQTILSSVETTPSKVRAALEGTEYAQGDKRFMYFRSDGSLCLADNFKGDHDVDRLFSKLYKTLLIFKPVFSLDSCPNYSLKRNKILLSQI